MMVTREEGLPEELVALMEDMKSSQKKANMVYFGLYTHILPSNLETKILMHLNHDNCTDDQTVTGEWKREPEPSDPVNVKQDILLW